MWPRHVWPTPSPALLSFHREGNQGQVAICQTQISWLLLQCSFHYTTNTMEISVFGKQNEQSALGECFLSFFSFHRNKHYCMVTHKILITLPSNNILSFKLLAWSITHFNNKKLFPFQYSFNFLFLINIQLNISICGMTLLIYWKLILFPGNVTWVALLG